MNQIVPGRTLTLRDPDSVAKTNADMRSELTTRFSQNLEWYEAFKASSDPMTLVEWVEGKIPTVLSSGGTIYIPTFIDNTEIGTVMIKMRWFTFDLGGGGISLLTGDRPLIRTYGLKDHRCIVALPLSPRFLFVATNAPETDRRLRRTKPEVLARDINARIVAQAKQNVYGATKEHLRFIENRLVRR